MKTIITKGIRLTQVRHNHTQKCCYCSEKMQEGTYNISFGSQNMLHHKNIWLHLHCAEPFLKQLKTRLPELKQKALLQAI